MAVRNIDNSALRTALNNGDPFEYAHLVKFERPLLLKMEILELMLIVMYILLMVKEI